MKVICPKCQFENQADSTRVVCARCATIIEVRVDQGSGFDGNGKRQTARLPFAANSSNSGNLSGEGFSSGKSGSLNNPPQNRDVYATRIGDDFDDVLDIPRSAQSEYSDVAEAVPVFEDVFSTNYDSSSNYDYSGYEKKSATPSGSFQADVVGQRVTQDYTAPTEPEFMGWPVLPENNLDEEEDLAGSAGSNRSGVIVRVVLIVAAFGVLSLLAYYFLWDFIAQRRGSAPEVSSGDVTHVEPPPTTGQSAAPAAGVNPNAAADANPAKPAQIIQPKPQAAGGSDGKSVKVDIPPIPITGPTGPSDSPRPAPTGGASSPGIAETPNRGNWTIQVGSFPDKGQADERISRLRSSSVDARTVRAEIPGRGTWYRVQVGGFPSRDEAMRYGNQLRSKGLVQDFIVVTKS